MHLRTSSYNQKHSLYQAKARGLDIKNKVLTCEDSFKNENFDVEYDYLVMANGTHTNTFNTPGVEQAKIMFISLRICGMLDKLGTESWNVLRELHIQIRRKSRRRIFYILLS